MSEWNKLKFSDLAVQEKGAIKRGPFGGAVKKEIFVDDGYKVYEQKNAIYDDFDLGTYFIDDSKYRELEGFAVKPNDLLVSCSGTIGRVAIVPENAKPGIINQALMRITPNLEVVTPVFLRLLIESPAMQKALFGTASGSAIKNVKPLSVIKDVDVYVPPLPEQRRIAAILDQADAIRRKRQKAIELTEKFLKSAFLEMFGDPVTNPKNWPTLNLGELIIDGPQNGLYKPSSEYGAGTPIIRIDSFYDGKVTDLETLKRVKLSDSEVSKFGVQPRDLLINRVNSKKYLGKAALVPSISEATVYESNMMRFRVNEKQICPLYLVKLLQTEFVKRQIQTKSRDAVNQSSINQEDVKSIQIRVPSIALQRQFSDVVSAHEQSILNHRSAETATHSLFNSLVQRAFRGELSPVEVP